MTDAMMRLSAALPDRYVIERELGAGGMATVYLAQDVRHDRKVALKVLRPELSAILGGERFLAEIKTTANLQHPHILPLHDSGEADGLVFYVMPYVDGESLRDRLNREKQLPVDDAVRIAREVADALEYAHQKGIVHRDIKPENVLLHGGHALVADFGIALAASRSEGGTRMTETGMSLGTPHYMSPEQAMGEREITPRADIYALGCVLYEMLTAEPPFVGPTAQAIIARVMTEEPRSLTLQRRTIPPHVEAAVHTALQKLPADRFASAAEFAAALAKTDSAVPVARRVVAAPAVPSVRRWQAVAVAATVLAVAAAAWAGRPTGRATPAVVGHYAVALDSGAQLSYFGIATPPRLALSPDGRELVYSGGRPTALYVRPLNSLTARPVAGTSPSFVPSVSWDGTQVSFMAGPAVVRVASLQGGPTVTLETPRIVGLPTWGPDGYVYYMATGGVVRRVLGTGGTAEDVVTLAVRDSSSPSGGSRLRDLRVLPGGRAALVFQQPVEQSEDPRLFAVDLESGRFGASLVAVSGEYVAEAGAIVYVAPDGTLMAIRFDPDRLATEGRPIPLFGGVSVRGSRSDLTVAGGTLAYARPGINAAERVSWVDRSSDAQVPVDPEWRDVEYESLALSPDGRRLAITIDGGARGGGTAPEDSRLDVWIKQLDRGPLSRLTFGGSDNWSPAWTADGRYVSYVSERDGRRGLWRRRADGVGAEEPVVDASGDVLEARWSHDGAWLVASVRGGGSSDIFVMRMGTDSALRPLLAEPHDEWKPSLSPDGRWLAYVSSETGLAQVFVRPFPDVQQGKWQISTDGGTDPEWGAGGRELWFRSPDGQVVLAADMARGPSSATVRTIARPSAEARWEINAWDRVFAVSADGRRFLVSATAGGGDVTGDLVIVQNFVTELRSALAGGAR